MNDFQPAYPDTVLLDPHKRVYYSHGLVLGVDEFVQEELYLLEKHRLHNRGLHGYGTVCGLHVGWHVRDGQPEVQVAPGIAIDPQGREIRVPDTRCSRLNEWLVRHHDEVEALLGSPPSGSPLLLPLYVVLCHDECATDLVPVPSGPCQSLDRTTVPSRMADHFQLELRTELALPQQAEELAVRALGELLDTIPVNDTPGGLTHEEMAELVRGLIPGASPPAGSPPAGHLEAGQAVALFRTAFRVWITEVRPVLLEAGTNCVNGPPQEACVLLARVELQLTDTPAGLRVDDAVDPVIDDSDRPYLLHSRLLQEFLERCCGHPDGGGGGGGVSEHNALSGLTVGDPHTQYLNPARGDARYSQLGHLHAMDDLSDVNAPAPAANDVLLAQGGVWVPGKVAHADLGGLGLDQHPQYLLADGSRPLGADWDVGNHKIGNLANATLPGDALPLGQAEEDFVRALGSPYGVAAAGRFTVRGRAVGPVYNRLKVAPVTGRQGVFRLTFGKYANPDAAGAAHNYVVKGTGEGGPLNFHVAAYEDRALLIQATPVAGTTAATGFNIEISILGKF